MNASPPVSNPVVDGPKVARRVLDCDGWPREISPSSTNVARLCYFTGLVENGADTAFAWN